MSDSSRGVTGADVKRLQANVKIIANETSFFRAFGLWKRSARWYAVLMAVDSSKTASALLSK